MALVTTSMTNVSAPTKTSTSTPAICPRMRPNAAKSSDGMPAAALADSPATRPSAWPSLVSAPTKASNTGAAASMAALKPSPMPWKKRWMRKAIW